MLDERFRERFEDNKDMTLQKYFSEQDVITMHLVFTVVAIVISLVFMAPIVALIIYLFR